jgi:hypothetical protein
MQREIVTPDQLQPAPGRIRAARILAVTADIVQIVVFPLFAPGLASPFNNALDLLVAVAMVWLIGWHWAFLPSFFVELVPGLDLVPTWTAAVFFVTRAKTPVPDPARKAHDVIEAEVVSRQRM